MKEIPTVLTSGELIDKILRRASSVSVKSLPNKLLREKNLLNAKIDCIRANTNQIFSMYEKRFPSIDKLTDFEKELLDVLLGCEKLHHALAAAKWCNQTVEKISLTTRKKVRSARKIEELVEIKKAYYGRITSVINQIDAELKFLNEARNVIIKIPQIDQSLPTVVIAGFPNVGKSTLVKKLSSAKPEIAPYPFTTKGLIIGHAMLNLVKYQFIDTPGLLDRPLEEKNNIEKQTILALRHLADIILFLIDPTGYSGTVEEQEKLLADLKREFKKAVFIVVETKADITRRKGRRLKVSAETGEGIEELIAEIVEKFKTSEKYTKLTQSTQ
ncbi:MAG: NOG1 family protein [Thermoplasmata archaeon]